ncbi:unnamed protein product [Urochloa humidicola]
MAPLRHLSVAADEGSPRQHAVANCKVLSSTRVCDADYGRTEETTSTSRPRTSRDVDEGRTKENTSTSGIRTSSATSSTRPTNSQERIAQPDASLAPSEVHVPNVSQASLTSEVLVPNGDDGLNLSGDSTHMTDKAARHNEDTFSQHVDNTLMADGADGITHSHQMNNEEEEEEWNCGVNLGHGLQRLTRSRRADNTFMRYGATNCCCSNNQSAVE